MKKPRKNPNVSLYATLGFALAAIGFIWVMNDARQLMSIPFLVVGAVFLVVSAVLFGRQHKPNDQQK